MVVPQGGSHKWWSHSRAVTNGGPTEEQIGHTVTNGAFRKILHDEKVRPVGDFDAGKEMSRDKRCT